MKGHIRDRMSSEEDQDAQSKERQNPLSVSAFDGKFNWLGRGAENAGQSDAINKRPEVIKQRSIQEAADHMVRKRTPLHGTGLAQSRSGLVLNGPAPLMAPVSLFEDLESQEERPIEEQATGLELTDGSDEDQDESVEEKKGGMIERAEELGGVSLAGLSIQTNSSEPAKYGAKAFASGMAIYLGVGQEKLLAHELWHVVQQRQGRVAATGQVEGKMVNEDPYLEQEADEKALQLEGLGLEQGIAADASDSRGATNGVLQFGAFMIPPQAGTSKVGWFSKLSTRFIGNVTLGAAYAEGENLLRILESKFHNWIGKGLELAQDHLIEKLKEEFKDGGSLGWIKNLHKKLQEFLNPYSKYLDITLRALEMIEDHWNSLSDNVKAVIFFGIGKAMRMIKKAFEYCAEKIKSGLRRMGAFFQKVKSKMSLEPEEEEETQNLTDAFKDMENGLADPKQEFGILDSFELTLAKLSKAKYPDLLSKVRGGLSYIVEIKNASFASLFDRVMSSNVVTRWMRKSRKFLKKIVARGIRNSVAWILGWEELPQADPPTKENPEQEEKGRSNAIENEGPQDDSTNVEAKDGKDPFEVRSGGVDLKIVKIKSADLWLEKRDPEASHEEGSARNGTGSGGDGLNAKFELESRLFRNVGGVGKGNTAMVLLLPWTGGFVLEVGQPGNPNGIHILKQLDLSPVFKLSELSLNYICASDDGLQALEFGLGELVMGKRNLVIDQFSYLYEKDGGSTFKGNLALDLLSMQAAAKASLKLDANGKFQCGMLEKFKAGNFSVGKAVLDKEEGLQIINVEFDLKKATGIDGLKAGLEQLTWNEKVRKGTGKIEAGELSFLDDKLKIKDPKGAITVDRDGFNAELTGGVEFVLPSKKMDLEGDFKLLISWSEEEKWSLSMNGSQAKLSAKSFALGKSGVEFHDVELYVGYADNQFTFHVEADLKFERGKFSTNAKKVRLEYQEGSLTGSMDKLDVSYGNWLLKAKTVAVSQEGLTIASAKFGKADELEEQSKVEMKEEFGISPRLLDLAGPDMAKYIELLDISYSNGKLKVGKYKIECPDIPFSIGKNFHGLINPRDLTAEATGDFIGGIDKKLSIHVPVWIIGDFFGSIGVFANYEASLKVKAKIEKESWKLDVTANLSGSAGIETSIGLTVGNKGLLAISGELFGSAQANLAGIGALNAEAIFDKKKGFVPKSDASLTYQFKGGIETKIGARLSAHALFIFNAKLYEVSFKEWNPGYLLASGKWNWGENGPQKNKEPNFLLVKDEPKLPFDEEQLSSGTQKDSFKLTEIEGNEEDKGKADTQNNRKKLSQELSRLKKQLSKEEEKESKYLEHLHGKGQKIMAVGEKEGAKKKKKLDRQTSRLEKRQSRGGKTERLKKRITKTKASLKSATQGKEYEKALVGRIGDFQKMAQERGESQKRIIHITTKINNIEKALDSYPEISEDGFRNDLPRISGHEDSYVPDTMAPPWTQGMY